AGLALAGPISRLVLGDEKYAWLVRIQVLTFATMFPSDVGQSYLRVRNRLQTFAVLVFLRLLANVTLNVAFLAGLGLGVQSVLWSSVITSGCISVWLAWDILARTAAA